MAAVPGDKKDPKGHPHPHQFGKGVKQKKAVSAGGDNQGHQYQQDQAMLPIDHL